MRFGSWAFHSCFEDGPACCATYSVKRFISLIRLDAAGGASLPVRCFNAALVFVFLTALFALAFQRLAYAWDWRSVFKYREKLIHGWIATIVISLFALVLSVAIGLAIAIARRSRLLGLRYLARVYLELIRGTPLLVQILIFFYVVAESIHFRERYAAGVFTLALFHGAYISEIIRAGIESVGKSQFESARAAGFDRMQTYRYVVFPQAIRQMLPAMAGELASLVKNSSLLSVIGISEFTQAAKEVNAYTVSAFESYIPLAIGYLLLTLPISLWTRHLESRNRYET